METYSPSCAGCGAPITLPTGATQATCEHCGAQLRIKTPERRQGAGESTSQPEVTLLEATKSGFDAAQEGMKMAGKGLRVIDSGLRIVNTIKIIAVCAVLALVLFVLAMIALCSAPLWWQSSPPESLRESQQSLILVTAKILQ